MLEGEQGAGSAGVRGREPRGQEATLGQTTEVPWKGHELEGHYVTFVLRGSLCCCIESRRWAQKAD